MRLAGRWALVTGAAKRVGRAIALSLGEHGTNVIVHWHRSGEEAAATVRDLEALGVRAVALRADLGQTAEVEALARDAEARSGGLSVLVNSASNYLRSPFDGLDEDDLGREPGRQPEGALPPRLHVGRAMRSRGEGRIVNIVDWAAERPYRDYLPYCVSKAGLVCLTRALAKELAPQITVNGVAPGPVLAPEDMGAEERRAIERVTPLKRFGTPEDVARCVRFLVEEADFTTGSIYHVDGGRLIA